jgi:hypothetical protein
MNVSTVLASIAVIGFGAAQYTLMYNALRDLMRRPRVRGGNKVLWGLVILCLPIAGALMYGWMGPTSFLSRQQRLSQSLAAPAPRHAEPAKPRNVTPITSAPSARRTRPTRPVPRPHRPQRTGS